MGGAFSKNNDNSISSQCALTENLALELSEQTTPEDDNLDPRSPTATVCRTPINEFLGRKIMQSGQSGISPSTVAALKDYENPKGLLKTKLSKDVNFKLNDPRSPNQFINRTPIVFDDSAEIDVLNETDKSINLDDTFSDLFVSNNKNSHSSSLTGNAEELKVNSDGKENLNVKDPRSPSFGVERTPIIFSDDDNDEDMIESFLDALKIDKIKATVSSELKLKKSKKKYKVTQEIYEDSTDLMSFSTPKRSEMQQDGIPKRTPLSCMGNISHLKGKNNTNANNDVKQSKMKFNFQNLAILKHSSVEEISTGGNK